MTPKLLFVVLPFLLGSCSAKWFPHKLGLFGLHSSFKKPSLPQRPVLSPALSYNRPVYPGNVVLASSSLRIPTYTSSFTSFVPEVSTCTATTNTLHVTRTNVVVQPIPATQYDYPCEYQDVEVTSVVYVPSTVALYQTWTSYPQPVLNIVTSYFSHTEYETEYQTSLATFVMTTTTHLLATSIKTEELTITQTTIVEAQTESTITLTDYRTDYSTAFVTSTSVCFFTETSVQPFYVSEIVTNTVTELSTTTETVLEERLVPTTVTVTERDVVASCAEPMISYEH